MLLLTTQDTNIPKRSKLQTIMYGILKYHIIFKICYDRTIRKSANHIFNSELLQFWTSHIIYFFFMLGWPCILNYMNNNQRDALYEVISKILRSGAAIYTAVVAARSTGPNRPNCEFWVLLQCFASTAWKRAEASPRTLVRTDLAASPWQRPISHFHPHPAVSGRTFLMAFIPHPP
jgi:hypothetical protein